MNGLARMGLGTFKWLDERLGIGMIWRATALHPVPRSVNWWYVFGSATMFAFIFQIVTGIFLCFSYVPSPDHAYDSLTWISKVELFGNIIRGLHYWGASAMVLLIFIHMTAHFLTGSYKYPRELNWWTGVVLLLLTLVMAFTGQLLRWNQDAYWAIVVGAEQAARTPFIGQWVAELLTAGPTVNGDTLTRIYGIHIWLVPAILTLVMTAHVYLVIYKGISEWPEPGRPVDPKTYWAEYQEILHTDGEPFFPVAVSKDVIFALIAGAVVVGLAIFVGGAGLGAKADPTTPANPRPDWYLIWYFALLALIPPASENYFIILFPAIGFLILFLIPLANKGERHYARRPWAVAVTLVAAIATTLLVWYGYQSPWSPVFTANNGIYSVPVAATQHVTSFQKHGATLMQQDGCMACHMIDNVGGQRGPNLTYVADRLGRDELIWRIARGGGGMPAYGNTMSPSELNAIVSFLQTRSNNQPNISQAAGGSNSGPVGGSGAAP